jgi:hypothetical protein
MMALFGASSKKKKEKPKKEKAPKEKAANEKPKSSFGLGGLFGKKQNKNTDVVTPTMPVQPQYQPVQQPQSYAPENQNTETDNNYYGFDDMGDSDETKYDGDMGTMAHLELLESSTVGAIQRISLDFQGNLTIGRMSNNGVQANILFNGSFKQISRMHAMIERKGNSYFIVDLGSANKTMLNNSVLIPNTPQPLNNGDRISFAVNTPVIYTVVL